MRIHVLAFLNLLPSAVLGYVVNEGTTCEIYPEALTHNGKPVDDAPSIHQAFDLCGINGTVIFTNHTFNVNSVLNTTNLINCDVSLRARRGTPKTKTKPISQVDLSVSHSSIPQIC